MSVESNRIDVAKTVGAFAEDKDAAKTLRTERILPALKDDDSLCLDFADVRFATQSFVHACISEGVRKFGERALKLIEFKNCAPVVRLVILTVVDYSLQLSDSQIEARAAQLQGADIPQADDLTQLRRVVHVLSRGITDTTNVSKRVHLSPRHTNYRIQAACILGLVDPKERELTPLGRRLLRTKVGGKAEIRAFHNGIIASRAFEHIAPDLFEATYPSRATLAERINSATGLAHSTSYRRAGTLLSWRRQIWAQLSLSL